MAIKVQLSPNDYLAANLRIQRWPNRILPLVGLAFIAWGALLLVPIFGGSIDDSDGFTEVGVGSALLIVNALTRFVYVPWRVNRIFRQQMNLQRPFEFGWDGESVWTSSEVGNSKRPWSDFRKWREIKDLFFLYHSDVMFQMIPKRFFPDQATIDEFRRLLREKLGKPR